MKGAIIVQRLVATPTVIGGRFAFSEATKGLEPQLVK
jgi:hypothetical protein